MHHTYSSYQLNLDREDLLMKKLEAAAVLSLALLVLPSKGAPEEKASSAGDVEANSEWRKSQPIIDVHGHIAADAIEKTLALMDANFLSRIVNLTPGRNAQEFSQAKKAFDEKGKGRFILYVNDVYENYPVEDPEFGKKVAGIIEECVRLGAKGLKISKSLGLTWKDKQGRIVPIDDPRLEPMWEACGRLNIPVSIHSGDPKAFWLPVDEKNERYDELKFHPNWAFGGGKFPPREEILRQLENVVKKHPSVTIVGVHFGNNPEDVDGVAAMLRKYPNFNVDLAARVPEIGRQDPAKLRKMFIEFQDRILFGTDFMVFREGTILGAGPRLDDPLEVKRYFDAHWRFLETNSRQIDHPTPIQGRWKIDAIGLPKEVLQKVYYKNAARIILKQKE
jgi:predicted TIM-barrel fold metal-dependent hydrolase